MQRRDFTKMALAGAVGAVAEPAVAKAQASFNPNPSSHMTMASQIDLNHCCGVILDVQGAFYSRLDGYRRPKVKTNTKNFVRLLGYFKVPLVVTLESPANLKGRLPREVREHLSDQTATFEKYFFDLTKEKHIRDHLASLNKKQIIVAGSETDVCVLQSCLGLLRLGYEVYMVEDLLFSTSANVDSAIVRMKVAGATFITYKTLFYELLQAERGGPHAENLAATYGAFPDDLPDSTV